MQYPKSQSNALMYPEKLSVIYLPESAQLSNCHDARARYVETYWLGVLGPSSTWLLRYLADELEASPSGFTMDLRDTAQRLGLAFNGGRNSLFSRALTRLCQFNMAQMLPSGVLGVRRHIPDLSGRLVERLSPEMRERHDYFQKTRSRTLQDA